MAADRWFFPTNTDNLKTILSHGLLCGAEGYTKYYIDISCDFPGFIPVFRNGNGGHTEALIKAGEEDDSLVVCLVEIELAQIVSGNVRLLNDDIINIDICKDNPEDRQINTLLLPAPLPLSCIRQVYFDSSDARKTFADDLRCYGDTPQGVLKLVAAKNKQDRSLFTRTLQTGVVPGTAGSNGKCFVLPPEVPARQTINYNKMYSLGGLLATLFYTAKNGSTTAATFAECSRMKGTVNTDNRLIRGIINYFRRREDSEESSSPQMVILRNVLDILVNRENRECISAIIHFLGADGSFTKPNERARAKELAERISGFYHNTIDSKASAIFAGASSKMEKALLLLAHREDVAGLTRTDIAGLEVFDEEDFIISAMLFGIRSKYYKIPLSIRQYKGIHKYISGLMAEYAHGIDCSGLTFKKTPVPLTVAEMVIPGSKKANWYGFMQWFSRKYSLQDCLQTIMPGRQFINDRGKSIYEGIVLPDIRVREREYFQAMSKKIIDEKDYETISKKYKSA